MKHIKLTAAKGKLLTNGKVYGKIVYLGNCDSADNWYEIPEEEVENEQTELSL
ncbi:MAG: hypothetical protein IKY33_01465 [Clostridia bacterium]|nr:hypothetical protein [Clostridia bacterium]MBR5782875.1 hypothetical protein [Clostridia bacterium]